jgi:hypothetical protein
MLYRFLTICLILWGLIAVAPAHILDPFGLRQDMVPIETANFSVMTIDAPKLAREKRKITLEDGVCLIGPIEVWIAWTKEDPETDGYELNGVKFKTGNEWIRFFSDLPKKSYTTLFSKQYPDGAYDVAVHATTSKYAYRVLYGNLAVYVSCNRDEKLRKEVWKIIKSINLKNGGKPLEKIDHPVTTMAGGRITLNSVAPVVNEYGTLLGCLDTGVEVKMTQKPIPAGGNAYALALERAKEFSGELRHAQMKSGANVLAVINPREMHVVHAFNRELYTATYSSSDAKWFEGQFPVTTVPDTDAAKVAFFGAEKRTRFTGNVFGGQGPPFINFWSTEPNGKPFDFVRQSLEPIATDGGGVYFKFNQQYNDKDLADRVEAEKKAINPQTGWPWTHGRKGFFEADLYSCGYRWVNKAGKGAVHIRMVGMGFGSTVQGYTVQIFDEVWTFGAINHYSMMVGNRSKIHSMFVDKVINSLSLSDVEDEQGKPVFSDEELDQPFEWVITPEHSIPVMDIPLRGYDGREKPSFKSIPERQHVLQRVLQMTEIEAFSDKRPKGSLDKAAMRMWTKGIPNNGIAVNQKGKKIGFAYGGGSLQLEFEGKGNWSVGLEFASIEACEAYINSYLKPRMKSWTLKPL